MRMVFGKLLLALALALLPAAAVHAQEPPPSDAARAAWGVDRSDLPPHPGVRFGVLPNGMRYAIMRNAVPAGGLSVRLRFDAGASVEVERELGFMHLIEHLIFHGTPSIPEGSLPLMLEHRGMRRFDDFNAFTLYDETVYRLDMARSDAAARDAALMLMREIAGNLVFAPRTVAAARRKVREEIRARDSVKDRLATAQNAFFAAGTAIARGPVAGTARSVGRASPAALKRLYETYYVPERAILVVAGDFDPAAAEREIAGRFADWTRQGRGAAAEPRSAAIAEDRGAHFRLFVDPHAPTAVTIASVGPIARTKDASAPRDAHFLEHLGAEMLNRRLGRLASAPDAPFLSASAATYDHFATARLSALELSARDRDWRRALESGASELGRALRSGFSEAEFAEQLAASRHALARAAAPRTTPTLADSIVDAAGRGIVFTVPADPAASSAYLNRIRLGDVNAAFRAAWARHGRHIFVSHNRRIPEAAIAAAWQAAAPEHQLAAPSLTSNNPAERRP